MQQYFEIGQIVNTNGLKGWLKINPFTDSITKFESLKSILVEHKKELLEFKIEGVRFRKNQVFLKLKGIETIEEAEKFREDYIKIQRDSLEKLPEDTYYIADLIGLDVYTLKQEFLGKLYDIFPTGSNDVYVVKDGEGKQILLPAIKDVIKEIDLKNKKIIVDTIKGLL